MESLIGRKKRPEVPGTGRAPTTKEEKASESREKNLGNKGKEVVKKVGENQL